MTKQILLSEPLKIYVGKIITTAIIMPDITTDTIELMVELDPIEANNKNASFWLHIYEFIDGTWRHVAGAKWQGGGELDKEYNDRNPRLWISSDRLAGKQVYVEIDDPKGKQVGYTLSVI